MSIEKILKTVALPVWGAFAVASGVGSLYFGVIKPGLIDAKIHTAADKEIILLNDNVPKYKDGTIVPYEVLNDLVKNYKH